MSDTVDPQEVENSGDSKPGTFSPWREGTSRPSKAEPPRTLTGMGPLGSKASTSTADLMDVGDDDDEPTRVFSTLFPDLVRKPSSASGSVPPPPSEVKRPSQVPMELVKSEPILDLAALEQQGAIQVTATEGEDDREDPDHASPTQEAQILDFALQKLASSESSPQASADPVASSPPLFKSAPPPPAPPRAGATATASATAPTLPRASVGPLAPAPRRSVQPPRPSAAPPVPSRRSASSPGDAQHAATGDPLFAAAASPSPGSLPPPLSPASFPPHSPLGFSASSAPHLGNRVTDPTAQTILASNTSDAPWATLARPAQPSSHSRTLFKTAVAIFALSAAVTVVLLRFVTGGDGSASITAVDADNRPLRTAEVSVDGKLACSELPCVLDDLESGKHRIAVKAGQLQAPEQIVTIRSGKDAKLEFTLLGSTANIGGTAGLHVRAPASGLRVYLNGEDKGDVPLTLGGLPAGEVTLKIAGNPLFAPFAQTVVLKSDSVLTLEPKLVPLKAVISIQRGDNAQGAFVEVIGPDRRQALFELPARVEVAPATAYKVRATRTGYRDFEADVTFAESEIEKEVQVALQPKGAAPALVGGPSPIAAAPVAAAPVAAAPVAAAAAPQAATPAAPAPEIPTARPGLNAAIAAAIGTSIPVTPATPPPPVADAPGTGTLNLNSIPISNVLIDGRPVGPTPRQVPIAAGKHSVTFVHPTLGRRSITVNVAPGKTALAATKF